MTDCRYDMPASFGPSLLPPTTTVDDAMAIIVSFETDPESLRALLPSRLSPGNPAIVSVSRICYPATDYMGGRGYNEIVVSLAAIHAGPGTVLAAPFAAALWVDQFGALFAGREFQGLPKLLGEIGPLESFEAGYRFHCSEYGAPLIRGEVGGLEPMPREKFEAVRRAGEFVPTFGWKHIPSPSGPPDADYATVNYTRWRYLKAWSGEGTANFMTPSPAEAPFGSRILARLAALPVRRRRRAFVGQGTVIIDRTMTRRLA